MIHTPIVIARPTSLALLAAMVLACAAPRPARAEDRLDTETIDRLRDQIAAAVPRVESPPRIAFPEIAFGTRELDEAIAAVVHASSGAEVLTGRELDAYLGAQGLTPRVLERFAQESEPPQEPTESDRARHRLLTEQFGAILTGEVRAWRRSVPWERRLVVHLRLT
ncbi:MAG: hypothetical protein KC466_21300, partial [Myxococcales bacterium]|nr:hypothetical protein [Myxococcales bacterium]